MRKKNSNEVVGVLTTHDLLRLLDKALSKHSHKIKELEKVGRKPIENAISKDIVKIQKDEKVTKALAVMHRKNVHTLPVYDGKKLVGVIGKHDVLNVVFQVDSS